MLGREDRLYPNVAIQVLHRLLPSFCITQIIDILVNDKQNENTIFTAITLVAWSPQRVIQHLSTKTAERLHYVLGIIYRYTQ